MAVQADQVIELLASAKRHDAKAATNFTDVVSLCTDEADHERVELEVAYTLLGRARMARVALGWAADECEKAIDELVQQVNLAEEHVTFARIDAAEEPAHA
jgi:hypothetical protein